MVPGEEGSGPEGAGTEVLAVGPVPPLQAVAVDTMTMADVARKWRREMGCTPRVLPIGVDAPRVDAPRVDAARPCGRD